MNPAPRYLTLQDYLRVLREQRLLILLFVVVAAGVGLFLSVRQESVYESAAKVDVLDVDKSSNRQIGSLASLYGSQAVSPTVRAKVVEILGPQRASKGTVSVEVQQIAGSLLFHSSASTGQQAADIANAYATAAVQVITDSVRERYRRQADELKRQLSKVPKRLQLSVSFALTEQQQIQAATTARTAEPLALTARAGVPGAPVSPTPVRNTLLAAMAGLILGVLAAFLRDATDSRVRRLDSIPHMLPWPVVGVVREAAMGTTGFEDTPDRIDEESFAMLRTNVEFLREDEAPRVIAVTSPLAGDGKSTIAMRIASAAANSGKRVLLAEGDLRRPVFAERLGLPASPGLADYLASNAQPRDLLHHVPIGRGDEQEPVVVTVMCAGSSDRPVSELVNSSRFETFVTEVRGLYDLVIIDCPPLLVAADPIDIGKHADAVLVCVRVGPTRKAQVTMARNALGRLRGTAIGVVPTGITGQEVGDYVPYGYDYEYDYPGRGGFREARSS